MITVPGLVGQFESGSVIRENALQQLQQKGISIDFYLQSLRDHFLQTLQDGLLEGLSHVDRSTIIKEFFLTEMDKRFASSNCYGNIRLVYRYEKTRLSIMDSEVFLEEGSHKKSLFVLSSMNPNLYGTIKTWRYLFPFYQRYCFDFIDASRQIQTFVANEFEIEPSTLPRKTYKENPNMKSYDKSYAEIEESNFHLVFNIWNRKIGSSSTKQ